MNRNVTISEDGRIITIFIPMKFKRRGGRKEIILPAGVQPEKPATALQLALASAFKWQKRLDSGEVESINELAKQLGVDKSYLAKQLRLTLLAPDIVEAILDGIEPSGLSLTQLLKFVPHLWEDQRKGYGFALNAHGN